MNREQFFEEVVNEVTRQFPPELEGVFNVEVKEVLKTNDVKLHGLIITTEGNSASPTMYLEDYLKMHEEGRSIKDIAYELIDIYTKYVREAPDVENMSFEFDDIKDKLTFQLVEVSRNKERLKELVYMPVDAGMAMVPYVELLEDEAGKMAFALTKNFAMEHGYNVDNVFEYAMANSMEKSEPEFLDFGSKLFGRDEHYKNANPLSPDFEVDVDDKMFVLSNAKNFYGASTLFYPGVQQKIAEILGESYYALPASVHEFIVVRSDKAPTLSELKDLVADANSHVVKPQDILSDKVLLFDKEKQKLYEPKVSERAFEDWGER